MEENKEKEAKTVQISGFREKLENFWYHYKWHTVAVLAGVLVITILLLQMLTKQKFDAYIIYAGDYKISSVSEDGDLPQHQQIISSLKRVCADENGDGAVDINLNNLYVLSAEQKGGLDPDNTTDLSLTLTDSKTLENALIVGNYYVCFMSEEIFFENDAIYDGAIFEPLAKYAVDGAIAYEYASERGIYLRSLPFGQMIDLPGDTVVCLRALNGYSAEVGKKQNTKNFAIGERIIKEILTYK